MSTSIVLKSASVAPGQVVDLCLRDGRIVQPDNGPDAVVIDVAGRPTIAGLADHHIHLRAMAAAMNSVDCSPSSLAGSGGLPELLRQARREYPSGWLRGVGFDLTYSGPLDRTVLDSLEIGPVRIQDRTGMWWILDSNGLAAVLPDDPQEWPEGVERDPAGHPTGRLYRLDAWLRTRLAPQQELDLAGVGLWLARKGVTAVCDATHSNDESDLAFLAAAALPQHVRAMTASEDVTGRGRVQVGEVKIVLDDHNLPPLDELRARIVRVHRAGRRVAVHCVSDVQVAFAVAAGVSAGDRIEHASLVPDGLFETLASRGVILVVQPGLIATRGGRYLDELDEAHHRDLYRLRSLCAAGITVALSSDAPYGPADPARWIEAACTRRTEDGRLLNPDERISERDALSLAQGWLDRPGQTRRVREGDPADLVVLDNDWQDLGRRFDVWMTIIDGEVLFSRG